MGPKRAVNSRGGEEVAVGGAGGVVELGEEVLEAVGIAQGQDEVEVHRLGGGELSDGLGLAVADGFAHVVGEDGLGLRGGNKERHNRDDCEE